MERSPEQTPLVPPTPGVPPAATPDLAAIYSEYFDFVWRSVRRMGVPDAAVDDAVQDVFVVVHARLNDFDWRASIKSWLFAIVRRVARDHRPSRRVSAFAADVLEALPDAAQASPVESLERAEAARTLIQLLDALDDDKREAFVLAEMEQLSAPEISEALGVNVNTVYARVRAARRELELALARRLAREAWRHPCAR
jgi:RNA polymerase sigma-70 factor (ECF subfamily)